MQLRRESSSKMIVRESRETFRLQIFRYWKLFVDETQGMIPAMSASKHTAKNYWKGENLKENWFLTWQLLPLYSQELYHRWKGSGKSPLTTTHLVHRSHLPFFIDRNIFNYLQIHIVILGKKAPKQHKFRIHEVYFQQANPVHLTAASYSKSFQPE